MTPARHDGAARADAPPGDRASARNTGGPRPGIHFLILPRPAGRQPRYGLRGCRGGALKGAVA